MSQELSYATFLIGGKLFGILIEDVQEILKPLEVTRVPLASMAFNGLINLRGNIVLAINMRQLLGLPVLDTSKCMNIVLKRMDEFYSLQVDSVADVVEVHQLDFEIPPETLPGETKRLISGTYRLGPKLLHVLDIGQILEDKSMAIKEKQSEVLS